MIFIHHISIVIVHCYVIKYFFFSSFKWMPFIGSYKNIFSKSVSRISKISIFEWNNGECFESLSNSPFSKFIKVNLIIKNIKFHDFSFDPFINTASTFDRGTLWIIFISCILMTISNLNNDIRMVFFFCVTIYRTL